MLLWLKLSWGWEGEESSSSFGLSSCVCGCITYCGCLQVELNLWLGAGQAGKPCFGGDGYLDLKAGGSVPLDIEVLLCFCEIC